MSQQDFGAIVEQYTDLVYNVAYRIMGNPHDAEDATQEAFLSAFRSWPSFRGQSAISTWLYRITVNACLMKLRKEKRARTMTEMGYDDRMVVNWAPDPSDSPEKAALNSELRQEVEKAVGELPPDLRAAVVLRDIQQLSNTEAAEALGITISALKARLHRARVLLRKHLEKYVRSPR